MAFKANIILVNGQDQDIWMKEMEFTLPPFPGLGIRIDVYEMLNVDSVMIGNEDGNLTCMVSPERKHPFTTKQCEQFGFWQKGNDPSGSAFLTNPCGQLQQQQKDITGPLREGGEKRALKAWIFFDGWIKETELPFPPFVGLGIRLDRDRMLTVWSVVTGDPHCDVTCITENKGLPLTEAEWERFGFERGSYP